MSLQFILGNAGAGKTWYACSHIIKESLEHPQTSYYVIVPEQFTMQTQKNLVEMHPGKGILNIDILSFERLAYRVFEEVGGDNRRLLEDAGKSMVIRKLAMEYRRDLPYLGSQMNRPGYIDEMKSLISELMQYDVEDVELERSVSQKEGTVLQMKLHDVAFLYRKFREYLSDRYLTGEEVPDVLHRVLPLSQKVKDSVFLFDGFTGFTPIQVKVLQDLLQMARKVYVTVTIDTKSDLFRTGKKHRLFYMSRKMIQTLGSLTREVEEPICLSAGEQSRFHTSPALLFMEQELFRYRRKVYEKEQDEIRIFAASDPGKEMEEAAGRIIHLVREKGMRYGEIAVITGNLQEYGPYARQAFEEAGIPYFLDEKHTILMNPFVEYLRAALEMVTQGFPYESVFRYLRCGLSDLSREETDRLENYVRGLGVRGFNAWENTWVRSCRGMQPETLLELNRLRARFVREVTPLAEGFRGTKRTVREYASALYHFICPKGAVKTIQEKLYEREQAFAAAGNRAMEKEYAQIYGIVMGLLDKMVEILGEETVLPREFVQLLETGMSEAKVALIPPAMDQVLIGDMERTRLKDVRALFFVGVNEGNIPKTSEGGGLLSEPDREFLEEQGLELAPGPKEQMNIQRFYLYLNLTKPSELLCLSYSRSGSQGEARTPASLLSRIRTLFPKLLIEEAGAGIPQTPLEALDDFLRGLSGEGEKEADPLFQELYSWYLRSPEYEPMARKLVEAAFTRIPADRISRTVAKTLYGEVPGSSATRLERFCACAFAHFLQYGLRLFERAEYEFKAMDMGNLMHRVLEDFAVQVRKKGLSWRDLADEERERLTDECLDRAAADYGNTILKSNARNQYLIERTRRILYRTVWALQQQLKEGRFTPEGFELSFEGGRIDRLDLLEEDGKVYVKVIDYKTGSTSFDLSALYHGLQLQLLIYLDAAMQVERANHPDKEVEPAGIFYYNIQDPMLQDRMETGRQELDLQLLKELKMNGLVQADQEIARKLDATLQSLPVALTKDGDFRKGSSVATGEQFEQLGRFVRKKIDQIRTDILSGEARVSPYELKNKDACMWCPYLPVCGYDRRITGFAHRKLKEFGEDEFWRQIAQEGGEEIGSNLDG